MTKPWICRLYPEFNSRLFVRVQVWPDQKSFLSHLNSEHRPRHGVRFGRRCQGTCVRYESITVYPKRRGQRQRTRKSPCVAEVNLHRGCLGIEVITHELMHATLAWAERVKFNYEKVRGPDVTAAEERLAYAHGRMCGDLTRKGMRPGGIYTDIDLVKSA